MLKYFLPRKFYLFIKHHGIKLKKAISKLILDSVSVRVSAHIYPEVYLKSSARRAQAPYKPSTSPIQPPAGDSGRRPLVFIRKNALYSYFFQIPRK